MTAREIAELLARDALGVCQHLLPAGRMSGSEWCAGDIHGSAGDSCKVRLDGPKAGVWRDFADSADSGGDLLDLWARSRSLEMREAIAEAKSYLGLRDHRPQFEGHAPRQYAKPETPKAKPVDPESVVGLYLSGARGIRPETLAKYRMAEEGDWIVFPYFRGGELVFWKKLHVQRQGGKKRIVASKDAMPILFGWQAIDPLAREVVICEGEMDALSLQEYGWPALSVPNGANGLTWIENEFDALERFDTIYLVFDQDEEGRKSIPEIVSRLGRHRCQVVTLPAKDANACLIAGIDEGDIEGAIRAGRSLDPEELKAAASFVDEVIDEFYPTHEDQQGIPAPWGKLRDKMRFRYGEVTVLAGWDGHGKSQAAGHITLGALTHNVRCCMASMEMAPRRWLARLAKQAGALELPTKNYIRAIHEWYADRLWVFDVVGEARAATILDTFAYSRRRYGVRFFVIDNLTKLDIADDDYRRQKDFIAGLCDFAKEHQAHIILVVHLRKGADEEHAADKQSIRGSGNITNLPDNVLILWRNRKREDALRVYDMGHKAETEKVDGRTHEEWWRQGGVIVRVNKQRHGEWEGPVSLWFDPASHQFLDRPEADPVTYVEHRGDPVWEGTPMGQQTGGAA